MNNSVLIYINQYGTPCINDGVVTSASLHLLSSHRPCCPRSALPMVLPEKQPDAKAATMARGTAPEKKTDLQAFYFVWLPHIYIHIYTVCIYIYTHCVHYIYIHIIYNRRCNKWRNHSNVSHYYPYLVESHC